MRRVVCLVVALCVLTGVVTTGRAEPVAAASSTTTTTPEQRQRDIDAELRKMRGQVADLDAKQQRAAAELQVTRRDRTALDAEVAAFDHDIATVQGELDQLTDELDQAIARQLAAQQEVDRSQAALRAATEVLHEQAIQAFITYGSQPTASQLLARIDDVNDAPRIAAWIDAVAERQASVVQEQRRLQADTAALEQAASDARDAVGTRRDEVAHRRSDLETVRRERAAAQAELAQEQATEQRLLDSLKTARAKAQADVAQLERDSAAVTALLQRRQAGQPVVPVKPGFLQAPVATPVITSTFGWRVHPIFGDRRLHTGVDFAADVGASVFAAADGTVVFAGWQSGYGNVVVIDHGGSLATLYAHNSAIAVAEGAKVKRGQRISAAGATGNATGPHVHFEVRVDGTPVDPLGYL